MKVSRRYLKNIIMEEHERLVKELNSVYANHAYITRVLGIDLPLNESGHYYLSEAKKAQILREHLLLEGLLDSITNYVKDTSGNLKNLLLTLKNIFSDKTGKLMEKYNSLLRIKVTIPILKSNKKNGIIDYIDKIIQIITNRAPELLAKLKQSLVTIKTKILEWYGKIKAMAKNSWKTVFIATTFSTMIAFAIDQIKDLAIDKLKDYELDKAAKWLTEYVTKNFTTDLANKIISVATDIKTYLGYIGPIAGGVVFFANTVSPVTKEIAAMPLPPQPTANPAPAPA